MLHDSEQFFEYNYIILICVLFFFCRHVLLVMFIIFSWIVWIQQECVSQLETTFARFELTDHALNQVEQLFLIYIILIFFFFFPPLLSVLVHFCPSSTKKIHWSNQACAPRYVWYSRNFKRREPIGTCYTARNNFEQFFEYSPCRTSKELCTHDTFF